LFSLITLGQKVCTIANKDENVLYVGVRNSIALSVSDIPNNNLKIMLSDSTCKVEKVDNNNYIITPKKGGRMEITVMNSSNGKEEIIGKYPFRAKRVPSPDISIMAKKPGLINKELVLSMPKIYALRPEGFDITAIFKVVEFKMAFSDTTVKHSNNKGNMLSNEQCAIIKGMKTGSYFTLYDVVVEAPEGIRTLPYKYTYILE